MKAKSRENAFVQSLVTRYRHAMKANVGLTIALAVVLAATCPRTVRSESNDGAIDRIAVQSSTMVSAGYAKDTRLLDIEFRSGAIYRYRQVPESVYAALSAARSKGRFFGTEIRGKFSCEKVRGAKR